jgi:hypothetical protein
MAALRSEVLAAIANCPLADNRFPVAASPQSDARRVGRYAVRHHAGVRWHWRCPVSRTFWDTFGASMHRADRRS